MADVSIDHVSKTFRDGRAQLRVVDDVSLQVADGEFVVLVGPSGCGKTTTLRMIAGLESPDSGDIRIGTRSVVALPPRERNVAMVFQDYALYPHMSVYENLAFALRARRAPREEIEQRVRAVAQLMQIDGLLQRRPRELSGGQRQRVAVGRALVRDPDVFLFDEPLSNLDAQLRTTMRVELAELHRRLGATMIYVTHDQVEAMTLGHRIVVMQGGAVRQIDTPRRVYEHPADTFVAQFIGAPAINLVAGEIRDGSFRSANWQLDLPRVPRAGRMLLGLRPEALEPAVDGMLGGTVRLVEHVGADAYIHVDVEGTTMIARAAGAQSVPHAGETLRLRADARRAMLFDEATGALVTAYASS